MTREEMYRDLIARAEALLDGETRPMPCMANICALIKEAFGFFWVGFYVVDGDELVLGPFQGPVACMTIKKGRGVCGAAWERAQTIVVDDVELFPGHIACNPLSRSEIVVPVMSDGRVVAVLDIDHSEPGAFDDTDRRYLERLMCLPFSGRIGEIYR